MDWSLLKCSFQLLISALIFLTAFLSGWTETAKECALPIDRGSGQLWLLR
jgi:hypothetical protein